MLMYEVLQTIFSDVVHAYFCCDVSHTAVKMVLIAETYMFGNYSEEVKEW